MNQSIIKCVLLLPSEEVLFLDLPELLELPVAPE